jgi:hypothetical protein
MNLYLPYFGKILYSNCRGGGGPGCRGEYISNQSVISWKYLVLLLSKNTKSSSPKPGRSKRWPRSVIKRQKGFIFVFYCNIMALDYSLVPKDRWIRYVINIFGRFVTK